MFDKSNMRIDKTNRAAGSGANEIDYGLITDLSPKPLKRAFNILITDILTFFIA